MVVTKHQKRAIEQRLAEFLKQYTETQVSKRKLAPEIGMRRENLYNVFYGHTSLTAYQMVLLLLRLMNDGVDIGDWIKHIIGEGEQCIFASGSSSLLQQQSLESELARRFRRHR